MGSSPNRPVGGANSGSWYTGLVAMLAGGSRQAPSGGASAPSGQQAILDQLRLGLPTRPTANAAAPAATAALALLAQGGASRLSASAWEALGQAYMSTNGVGRSQMAAQLSDAGFHAESSQDGRFVTFTNGTLYATCEPSTQRLRVTNGDVAGCYVGNSMVERISFNGNTATVVKANGTETWDSQTGQGTVDGVAIRPRQVPVDPDEPPRGAALEDITTDDLAEPTWSDSTPLTTYGDEYDAAVEAMGGQVVEPSQTGDSEADQFNCHSYALTGGEGDLFDPFSRAGFPHWLNNPMYKLSTGNYGQVGPNQRVHPGDIVVYANNGVITHTGVVRQVDPDGNPTQIESKFGALGLYEHGPADIPPDYGSISQIFRPLDATS